ncbi:MAG TPA: tRNA (adenosine(37)-N6)-threonylcarbamoyltransferase complex ATPase subunit type 1 TsaE [Armatimonadota bacterium]|nr:tRNA (adenosine(37)-N6)-threonylcarbamoyltransferase complex ATPase subunit type 1 TsaE [Armatimonadota bacterium]
MFRHSGGKQEGESSLWLPSPRDTLRLGQALGRCLEAGDCVALFGPVGAGKTTLVQGMAEGTGSEAHATSPSFVLVHRYAGTPNLLHADLYRIERVSEFEDLALEEMAEAEGAAMAIEWCERCRGALPAVRLEVHMSYAAQGRQALPWAIGSRAEALLDAWRRAGFGLRGATGDRP